METKIFSGKKIKIRELSRKDSKNAKKFQDIINSLIEEEAQISRNEKLSLKEEKEWLKKELKMTKAKRQVFLAAEHENVIIGTTGIGLGTGRSNHVGGLGISIRKGYRGIGLGTYMMEEIMKLAKKKLKPRPKIIRLSVFPTNKPAIGLYKKFGFKKVAAIPKQFEYKGKLLAEIIMTKEI